MLELLVRNEVAPCNLCEAAAVAANLGRGRHDYGQAAREVEPERLPHEFGAGTMFGLSDLLELGRHRWREGDCECGSGSHRSR